jgi:hypothetical protein
MRVLLVCPPSPERLGAPLLGLQYVAAALLRGGHEVRVLDAAARHFPLDEDEIVAEPGSRTGGCRPLLICWSSSCRGVRRRLPPHDDPPARPPVQDGPATTIDAWRRPT